MGKLRPGAGPLETIGSGLANRDPNQVGQGLTGTVAPQGPALKRENMPDGPWLPHVAEAVRICAGTFGLKPSTYAGHGIQPGGGATAADFVMPSGWGVKAGGTSKAKGDALVAFVEANWGALNIQYVIWYDRIKGPQTGNKWIQYPIAWKAGYGSGATSGPDVEHTDHVHLSFKQSGPMPDINKLNAPSGIGGELSNIGGAATDWMSNIPEWIAQGIANGFLRLLKAVYGYAVLRPLDFAGGFWWELTKLVAGFKDEATKGGETDSNLFSEKNRTRLWTLGFLFATYYLAFGREGTTGEYHLDRMLHGGADLVNRDMQGSEKYNDVARIRADVKGVTVARRRNRHTTRRTLQGGSTKNSGSTKRRVRPTPERDGTGRFVGGAKRNTQTEEKGGRRETQGSPVRRGVEGSPNRDESP